MKMTLILLLASITISINAQNLLINGGFEDIRTVKKYKYPGTIEKAHPWFSCGNGKPTILLNNAGTFGPQIAAEGKNYASIVLYDHGKSSYREYLGIKLRKKLKAGSEYSLQFCVSAADETWAFTDELGIFMGPDSLVAEAGSPLPVQPQFKTRRYLPISDTARWQRIEYRFTAKGDEAFLYVGNFRADAATLIQHANRGAWTKNIQIYLDAFQLQSTVPEIEDNAIDTTPKSGPNASANSSRAPVIPTMLSPNNDGFNDVFLIANLKRYSTLTIFNKNGERVFQTVNYANDFEGSGLPEGNYSFELKTPEGNIIYGSFDLIRNGKRKS